mgnify:CR=1 FL=1
MQFRDLKAQYEALKPEIDEGIRKVIENTSFILGSPVTELENMLAEYVGRKHCIGVGNGTDALHLALKAIGVGEGDAVFVPDFTYVASAVCANLVGAVPVMVDIDLDTFNMSAQALEEAIKETLAEGKLKPRAIIPVDLFGLPADYRKIIPVAEKYGLKILEDAAQGFGGEIGGKLACSFGNISATSFFPAKPLGCYGDGGAIFTDDDEADEYLRSIRVLGRSKTDKYDNVRVGTNSRLDTLQAAILIPKFKAFREYEKENVNKVACWYTERLCGHVITPVIPEDFISSFAQYTILLEDGEQRNRVQKKLKEAGIPSMIYYPRGMHQQGVFKDRNFTDEKFPNTIQAVNRCLSLPMHPYMDEKTADTIAKTLIQSL